MNLRPNVIVIVLDTLRADHLSCYGYFRKTTPNIDKIAHEGVLYENAFSTAEWTPPSHASLFTGKYPSHHRTLGRNLILSKENVTLAEILSRIGYQTLCVTANRPICPETS
jgi:choline-sulfatase